MHNSINQDVEQLGGQQATLGDAAAGLEVGVALIKSSKIIY
jgi:hypothetical protein